MTHVVVIIQRSAVPGNGEPHDHAAADGPTYEYRMPVPHGSTPQQVGEMVKRAFKRLEGDEGG